MAQVFRMGTWTRMRHVVIPQLAPYLAAAARSGLSLVWKIVLIVELLGRPNGVGFEIGVAFQLFDVTRILAYALAFIAVMLAIETLLVQPLERHVARWRQNRLDKDRLEVGIKHKSYRAASGSLHVLGELAFSLSGEVAALVGPSGCGKTTLLRILAGLDRDFEGSVKLPAHGTLGMVFQEPRLLPWRTVEQNVRLAAPRATDSALDALFRTLGLAAHRALYPGELSLGLARRVALARIRGRARSAAARRAVRFARRRAGAAARGAGRAGQPPADHDAAGDAQRRRGNRAC